MKNIKWVEKEVSIEKVLHISQTFNLSSLAAKVILGRGLIEDEEIRLFLNPQIDRLYDSYLMKDMDKAVKRILQAIENHEKILIYGDYDADGITSVVILYDFLMQLGLIPMCYIPKRMEEGYGLTQTVIPKILESGATLIITVDCGISAVEEVEILKNNSIDVIIMDHHECGDSIPDAYAVVDPCQSDCNYPYKYLAGVGVVFKVICALAKEAGLEIEVALNYLDLIAIGTVSDVVRLTDENRIITKFGLNKICNSSNIGLRALLKECGLRDKCVDSFAVAYNIAPRLNAAGRMGEAIRGVKLLLTKNERTAQSIALDLINENNKRQAIEREIFNEVVDIIEEDCSFLDKKVLVVKGENWHYGMLGIVASKVTSRYYKPCVIISCCDDFGKASARSIIGFDMFQALKINSEHLIRFGGHKMAAGLTLLNQDENIREFDKAINKYADEVMDDDIFTDTTIIDCTAEIEELTIKIMDELEVIGPFGAGNPSPIISLKSLKVDQVMTLSNNKHVRIIASKGEQSIEIIGFNMVSILQSIKCGDLIDVIGIPEINQWAGKKRIQLNLKDAVLSQ